MKNRLKSFTLVEIVVTIGLFALLFTVIGGTFYSTINAWTRQKNSLQLIQDSRSALDFICNEVHHAQDIGMVIDSPGGLYDSVDNVYFDIDDDDGGTNVDYRVWYWYIWSPPALIDYVLYRGIDTVPIEAMPFNSFAEAVSNQRKLLTGIEVDSTNPVFSLDATGQVVSINLRVRAQPDRPEGMLNRNITVQTKARIRN